MGRVIILTPTLENSRCVFILMIVFFAARCGKPSQKHGATKLNEEDKISFSNTIQPDISLLPDTSINDLIFLRDPSSISNFIDPKKITLIDKVREVPVAIFHNKDKTEYLMTYFYYGDVINQFSVFEVGFCSNEAQWIDSMIPTNYVSFSSESISLGMPKADLIKVKGDDYQIESLPNGVESLKYTLSSNDNKIFLRRYNMPSYFLECYLNDGKVKKIRFGFDYP